MKINGEEIKNNTLIWHDGDYLSGNWHYGIFKGGNFLKSAMGMGGKLFKGFGLRAGATALASGASSVIGGTSLASAGAAVGGAATAIAGVISSPVVIGGVALAGAAYGSYKLYKYVKNKITPFMRSRFYQYGFLETEKHQNHFNQLSDLERYLVYRNCLKISGDDVNIDESKINVNEILQIFSIDIKDKESVDSFLKWFHNRFKPFFFKNVLAYYKIKGSFDLFKADDLNEQQKILYLNESKFPSGPYNEITSPFNDVVLSPYSEQPIKYIDNLISEYKFKSEKSDPFIKQLKDSKIGRGLSKLYNIGKDYYKSFIPNDDKRSEKEVVKEKNEYVKMFKNNLPKDPVTEDGKVREISNQISAPVSETLGNSNQSDRTIGTPTTGTIINKPIPMASGKILDGSGAMKYIKMDSGLSKQALEGLHPTFLKMLLGAIQEYGEKTGRSILLKSGFRSRAQQEALYRSKPPGMAAKPGNSLHEFGLAVDINSADANQMEKAGVMKKYGLTRPVGKEAWHIESAGIQQHLQKVKKDPNLAAQLIESAIGRGGGGLGLTPNKGRDPIGALKLFNSGKPGPVEEIKDVFSSTEFKSPMVSLNLPAANDASIKPPSSGNVIPFNKSDNSESAFFKNAETSSNINNGSNISESGSYAGSINTTSDTSLLNQSNSQPEVEKISSSSVSKPSKLSGGKKEILNVIENAAKKVGGVSPVMLKQFAAIESDLNPNAGAGTSSAKGLFQFITGTWREVISKWGNKYGFGSNTPPTNPEASAIMGAEYLKQNLKTISGVAPNPSAVEAYMTHLLGPGGARKMLSAGDSAIAAQVDSKAANANKSLFYSKGGGARTIGGLKQEIARRIKERSSRYGIPTGPIDTGGLPASYEGSVANMAQNAINNSNSENSSNNAGADTQQGYIGATAPASGLFAGIDTTKYIPSSVPEKFDNQSNNTADTTTQGVSNSNQPSVSKNIIAPPVSSFNIPPISGNEKSNNSDMMGVSKGIGDISVTLMESLSIQKQILSVLRSIDGKKSTDAVVKSPSNDTKDIGMLHKGKNQSSVLPEPAVKLNKKAV